MNNTDPFLSAKKIKKNYKAQIVLNPMPNNCEECPFYYMPNPDDEGTWYEDWDCYLGGINDITGIALNRPKSCPLQCGNHPIVKAQKGSEGVND